jgi:uncharacterized repeat protein (TIGR01451 family)
MNKHKALLALLLLCGSGLAHAAITVHVELNPNPPRPGEGLHAQVTVANNGASAVTLVSLRGTMPSGVNGALNANYFSIVPTSCNLTGPSSSCDPGDTMNFNIGTLPAGAVTTVSMVFTIAAATPAGTVVTLPVSALINNVITASATDSVTVSTDNALSLAVNEDFNGAPSGGTLTYTLAYGNRSIDSVTGTALSLPLPAGATFVSATGGGSAAAGTVTWNLGTLLAGQSGRQQVVVTLPGGLVNGTVLEPADASITGTSLAPEAAFADTVTLIGGGALGVSVELNPDPVRAGERLRTEITITNRTGASLTSVVLRARAPENINTFSPSYVSLPPSMSVTNCNLTGSSSSCDAYDLINIAVGTLPAGAAVTITLPPVVAAATASGRVLSWETLVFAGGVLQSLATRSVPVDSDHALTVAVDENLDAVAPGDPVTYNLTYGNRSIDSVNGTTLTFPVPVGMTVTDANGGTVSGNLVSWNLGTLLAGESGRRQIIATAGAGIGAGTLLTVDAAIVRGTNSLGDVESARGTAATNVRENQALGIGFEVNPDPARSNERLRTTLTVVNSSGAQLSGVVVKARVPDSVATFSASGVNLAPTLCNLTGGSSSCDAGDVAAFTIGTMPADAIVTLTIPTAVAADVDDGVVLVWEGAVTATGGHNSTIRHSVTVDNGNALTLGVDDNVDAVAPDGTLVYSLTYGNRGISTVTGTTLGLVVPPGLVFVGATDGGAVVGDEVRWTIGSLLAGQSGRRQVTFDVANAYTDGEGFIIDAVLSGGSSPIEESRATAVTAVRSAQALGLAIEANPDPARRSEQLRTEVAVTNRTGATLFNVFLRIRVPDPISTFSGTYSTGVAASCNLTGPSSSCDSGDLIVYSIGDLAAGQNVVYSIPAFVGATAEDGRVLVWEAVATADGSHQSVATHHVPVDSTNALTLAIDDTPNATPANGVLTYVLTFGNRSITPVTGTTLSVPIPQGATLLSSTGGTLTGNVLNFNVGTIAAGQGGRRQLRVQLGPDLPAGSLIYQKGPQLSGTSATTGLETARAAEVTPVEGAAAQPGLLLRTRLSPNPASPGTVLTGTVTLSNNTGVDLSNVVARVRVPDFVTTFAQTGIVVSQGTLAGCNLTGGSSSCDVADKVNWTIGTMLAGAEVTLTFPTTVVSGASQPSNGQLLALYADAEDALGFYSSSTDALLVGTFTDGDSDGIPTVYDNCLNHVNPDQRDTNFDGFGNLCDADLNNSNVTNAADLALFRAAFGSQTAPDADLNGSGAVNAADLALFRALFGLPPGPSALAP